MGLNHHVIELGDFNYGDTVYCLFNTFAQGGESITLTGLAVTDIEVYKNGGTTQRASDNGYTLLDTDGIDFDSVTGIHGFSIDTSDNTTAGFWAPNSDYYATVQSVTIDSDVTVIAFHFTLEKRPQAGLLVRTTIATLASQTSFTLTAGSADNDAYNNCIAVVYDVASTVQKCVAAISDYTGATKTVTLLADPGVFTMAASDYIAIYADLSLKATVPTRTLNVDSSGALTTVTTATTASALGTQAKADVNAEVLDVINVDTFAAPSQGAPASTTTLSLMLRYLYKAFRNKKTQTSTTWSLFNDDESTVDHKATVSDDGTTATKGEIATGP